jgi:hypothetical protein
VSVHAVRYARLYASSFTSQTASQQEKLIEVELLDASLALQYIARLGYVCGIVWVNAGHVFTSAGTEHLNIGNKNIQQEVTQLNLQNVSEPRPIPHHGPPVCGTISISMLIA